MKRFALYPISLLGLLAVGSFAGCSRNNDAPDVSETIRKSMTALLS